jgi:hypothetical protein
MGALHAALLLQLMSRGRNQGNQTGIGFNEKHGAGTTKRLPDGRQIDAFPMLIQGRILNSVLIRVGHMGRSKGTEMGPTLSGGIGRSGVHPAHGAPAKADDAAPINISDKARTKTVLSNLMSIPQSEIVTEIKKHQRKYEPNPTTLRFFVSRNSLRLRNGGGG